MGDLYLSGRIGGDLHGGYLPLWDSVDQPEAAEVIAAMPTKRQTLFRGVWHGMSDVPGINRYYEEANRAV